VTQRHQNGISICLQLFPSIWVPRATCSLFVAGSDCNWPKKWNNSNGSNSSIREPGEPGGQGTPGGQGWSKDISFATDGNVFTAVFPNREAGITWFVSIYYFPSGMRLGFLLTCEPRDAPKAGPESPPHRKFLEVHRLKLGNSQKFILSILLSLILNTVSQ